MFGMSAVRPPQPPQKPKTIAIHGEERIDPLYGYRDKTDREVLNYIEAENRYADRQMAETTQLQNELFTEMKQRIKETDVSAPIYKDGWTYYTRTQQGKQYSILCRTRGSHTEEEIILDQNLLAQGHAFFSLGVFEMSPDHTTVAYAVDVEGAERYTLSFKDVATDSHYAEYMTDVAGLVWAMDARTCYYTVLDSTHRPYRVYKHVLGTSSTHDVLMYEEEDEKFSVGVDRSADDSYIFMESQSMVTSEVSFIKADGTDDRPRVFWERQNEHEYVVDYGHGVFYVLSNDDAPDFKLLEIAPEHIQAPTHWYERIPHRPGHVLDTIELFTHYVVVGITVEGLTQLCVRELHSGTEYTLTPPEELYDLDIGPNPEFDRRLVRFEYSSLVTPRKVVDYDMHTGAWHIVKAQEIPGGFDPNDYVMERRYATAEDGTQIPISLAYQKNVAYRKSNPLWLGGYGSYGLTYPMRFSVPRLSLLDRGFVFAFAHVRGGGVKGRQWYENGKYLSKQNTFSDYIASAEWLIEQGYTVPHKLIGHGGSAGGLLIGVVANQRPELFHALVAEVPFVDTLNTMLDTSLPLTQEEFEEWGNPQDPQYYQYIRAYAPYENVHTGPYPHMYVRSGLNDVRVSFWEPTKWVAKLRTHKQDDNLLLLRTDTEAGHTGSSGRYEALKELAEIYAFAIQTTFRARE